MRFRSAMCVVGSLICAFLLVGSATAQGGQFVGAEWGVPGHTVDVTARVRTFIHDGVLQLEVTRFNLGIDPAPHQNKTLIIRVRNWGGDVKAYNYPERTTANLELDPPDQWERREANERHDRNGRREASYHRDRGLRVLRAYYGADGQFANVTDALRSRIDDGRLFLRVDNYSMGVDPRPGVRKSLRVLYVYNGQRRDVVVDEKTNLQLP
jgi:hypothetical protein